MTRHNKLSLWTAMLICLNVMFGTGLIINTVNLTHQAGALGFISYIVIAALILPLILSMAAILRYYPSGGFYVYAAKTISPLAGFISAWAYFIGKLGSAALLVHVFVSLIKTIFPAIIFVNILWFDTIILLLFAWLNLYNMKTGTKIMYGFIVLKLIPVLFAILSGLYLCNYWSMPPDTLLWEGIPSTLPLVLFAFIGFEVATSISRNIKNAKVNAPKVILYSFFFVISLTIAYQLLFFLALGKDLMAQTSFLGAFPALLAKLFPTKPLWVLHGKNIIHLIIATSALGGAYGILFSNHWNLYALAQHRHTFFWKKLTTMNKNHIPMWGIVIEAIICIVYLIMTQGRLVILQQISVFGCIIAYALSVIGLLRLYHQHNKQNPESRQSTLLPWLAIGSCSMLTAVCIRNLFIEGPISLFVFTGLIGLGIAMFFYTKDQHTTESLSTSAQANIK